MMASQTPTMDTEEYLPTCLHIKLYHPQQSSRGLYGLLPMDGGRQKRQAEDPLRIGRDGQACTFTLDDSRVSRKQLAFQAYRKPNDSEMRFSLQNLSQKGRVHVDGSVLGYLERRDLPDKALIRFLDYEVLVVRVSGEASATFEVEFEVLVTPPSREMGTEVPSMFPVMEDTARSCNCLTNDFPSELRGPLETDETLHFHCAFDHNGFK